MIDYLASNQGSQDVFEKAPYKKNKLTFLLINMLFGNFETFFLLNCNAQHISSTLETLNFAEKVNKLDKLKLNIQYSEHLQNYLNVIKCGGATESSTRGNSRKNNNFLDSNEKLIKLEIPAENLKASGGHMLKESNIRDPMLREQTITESIAIKVYLNINYN